MPKNFIGNLLGSFWRSLRRADVRKLPKWILKGWLLKATAQAGSPRFDADPMFPMKFWPFGGYILFSDTHHPMFILVTNCVFLAVDDLFLVVAGF